MKEARFYNIGFLLKIAFLKSDSGINMLVRIFLPGYAL